MIYRHKTMEDDRRRMSHSCRRCWKVRSSRFSSRRFLTGLTQKKETLKVTTFIHSFKSEQLWSLQLTLALGPQWGTIWLDGFVLILKSKEFERKWVRKFLKKDVATVAITGKGVQCKVIGKSHWKLIVGVSWSDFKCFLGKSVSKTEIALNSFLDVTGRMFFVCTFHQFHQKALI